MATNATFIPTARLPSVSGDNLNDTVTINRNATGFQVVAGKHFAFVSLILGGVELLRSLAAKVLRMLEIRRQCDMLHAMSDELLHDVGLSRCELDGFAERIVDGRTDPTRRPRGVV